ncbi:MULTISPECIES: hypothetical protein [unclassified Peribacillus]|uniref:hypothetical protein n=1 Tax=unclassified Peribacillus TaxID=2675266 RepID=UPI0019138FAD|nr:MULTISPECIES: hypothetical protein [unclassified Peribacillus]MBK5459993.1 hypothetical protein [Peribacillus sp. TH27]MBK5498184.1 hypothetical protein [Peribacillus sp. TH14]WMX56698.1 hypothetical protein RE409_05610 [Peribacillus sp. R9-11]
MQSAFNKENNDSTLPYNFDSLVRQQQQIFNVTPVNLFNSADESPFNCIVNDWIINDCIDFIGNKTIMALHKDEDNKSKAEKTATSNTPKIVKAGQYVMESFDSMQVTNTVQDTLVFSKDVWIVS